MSSEDQLKAELEKLKKENAMLKGSGGTKGLTFKVSQKGAVSVYGMGRFPVTLYKEQWIRLLDKADELKEFIDSHEDELKVKE